MLSIGVEDLSKPRVGIRRWHLFEKRAVLTNEGDIASSTASSRYRQAPKRRQPGVSRLLGLGSIIALKGMGSTHHTQHRFAPTSVNQNSRQEAVQLD
jgi:hypothetical protein